MFTKKKYRYTMQYKIAREIANGLLAKLTQHCINIDVAGSVRREKADVKDIELCVNPKVTQVKDLFGEVLGVQRLASFVSAVKKLGIILKGDVREGRYVQIALPEGINLDLFIPQPTDYWRQYIIRSGPSEYSHNVVAVAWLKKGYCGTKDGLRLQEECYKKQIGTYGDGRPKFEWICNSQTPTLPPQFSNEYDFFTWLQIHWMEPSKRQ